MKKPKKQKVKSRPIKQTYKAGDSEFKILESDGKFVGFSVTNKSSK